MNNCKRCGEKIGDRGARAIYCSRLCRMQRNNDTRRERTKEKFSKSLICKGCGAEFFRQQSGRKIFCTNDCKNRFHARENRPASRWKRIELEYGISKSNWEDLLVSQNGMCAICLIKLEKPHTDHDHKTGKVRGLLCQKCNQAIGLMMDSPDNLIRAARYLS